MCVSWTYKYMCGHVQNGFFGQCRRLSGTDRKCQKYPRRECMQFGHRCESCLTTEHVDTNEFLVVFLCWLANKNWQPRTRSGRPWPLTGGSKIKNGINT